MSVYGREDRFDKKNLYSFSDYILFTHSGLTVFSLNMDGEWIKSEIKKVFILVLEEL